MLIYATESDLADWMGVNELPVPVNIAGYLRSASLLVARAVNESLYNPGAVTTDPKRDATCAQTLSWMSAKIDPTAGTAAIDKVAKSKGIGSATISYDVVTVEDRAKAISELCPDACAILFDEGLLWVPTPQWQACPDPGQYVNELGEVSYGPGTVRPGPSGWFGL